MNTTNTMSRREFIALMAMMMSLVALSIDAILPAFGFIGTELNAASANDVHNIITFLFLGLGSGQLLFGPLSDSFGRRNPVFLGFAIFFTGSLLCAETSSMQMMLLGRFMQGFGLAAPRTLSIALIRDQYKGVEMAKLMSLIMGIFILVPMLAPALGQVILASGSWRNIFRFVLALAVLVCLWFFFRQHETLSKEKRRPFSPAPIVSAAKEVLTHPVACGYTLLAGVVHSTFLAYLSTSQQLLQDSYQTGQYFAAIFALLAFGVGFASFLNGNLVGRFGMQRLVKTALFTIALLASVAIALTLAYSKPLPLWLVIGYLMLTFLCCGILFGNLNALAMEPIGHIAGIGAAIVGSLSTLVAVPLSALISSQFQGTATPLIVGFLCCGVLGLSLFLWINRHAVVEET